MVIKHIILLVSIFYLLSSSTSESPESPDSTPESPDSTPESPDSTPESPDSTPESPDSTPESPDSRSAESDSTTPSVPASSLIPGVSYPDIEKKCGATSNPIDCVTLFSPLTDSDKKDPIAVLKAGLNAVSDLSNKALEKAELLKKDPKTSANTGSCLGVCIENYNSLPKSTESALEAIEKKDMDGLKTYLSADVTNINTCIDVHDKNKSPLKEVDSTILGLVRANLQIGTDMVKF